MLSEKLKENTKTAHIELEKVLVQKIKSIRTTNDYLEILVYFHRFFTPLEKAISSQLEKALPDVAQRRKSEWIMEDIQYFDPAHPPISTYPTTPQIDSHSKAIGALYVIEGSTLGGQVICKMISQKLGISTKKGLSFFSGYGEKTGSMWENFKNFINGRNWSEEEEREIIDTANRTFTLFKQSID